MKTLRESFEENYIAIKKPCANKKGFKIEYVYYGPWYMWDISKTALLRTKRNIGVLCVLNIAFLCVASLQDSPINYSLLVEIPGVLSLLALMFQIIGIVQFICSKEKMTRYTYNDINIKMGVAVPFHAFFMTLSSVGGLCVLGKDDRLMFSITAICGYAMCAVIAILIYKQYKKVPFTSEKNRTLDTAARWFD